MKRVIWTRLMRPERLDFCGYATHSTSPVGAEVEVGVEVGLGFGWKGYTVQSPLSKETFIVEHLSGCLLAVSLERIQSRLGEGTAQEREDELTRLQEVGKGVIILPVDQFWKLLGS